MTHVAAAGWQVGRPKTDGTVAARSRATLVVNERPYPGEHSATIHGEEPCILPLMHIDSL
jgi:hypothetical protein